MSSGEPLSGTPPVPAQEIQSGVMHEAAVRERASDRASWTVLSVQLFLFFAAFGLLWPTTASLIAAWEDVELNTYTHGYLIVAISLWLLWRQRAQLASISIEPFLLACVPLAGGSLLWLVAVRSGMQSVHQLLLPILAWLAVCAALGVRAAAASAFAFAYLYTAIPLWGTINSLLQEATVVTNDFLLRATGIPAYVDGNTVHLAAGALEIAGGCSGLHYFIVAFAIGALYGEVRGDAIGTRLKILGLALLLALITNWVRVYLIIAIGYVTDMQHYLIQVEHNRFGWVLFAVMIIAFFLIARSMPWREQPLPVQKHGAAISGTESRACWPLALPVALAAISFGPAWNVLVPSSAAAMPTTDTLLPPATAGWSRTPVSSDAWQPRFIGADAEQRGFYSNDRTRVEAFVAAYVTQAQKKELVGYNNSLLGDDAEQVTATRRIEPRGPVVELQVTDAAGQQALIWYFYRIDSLQTASDFLAQVSFGTASLVGSPISSVIALRASCEKDCSNTRAALQELLLSLQL